MQDTENFKWQRKLIDPETHARLGSISYMAQPKFPHDSMAHDRELVESHFEVAVETMSDWHWYGRRFTLTDGTRGRIDAR